MNTARKCTSLVVGSLLLVGCASSGTAQLDPGARHRDSGYDVAYMAAVERASESSGVEVIWINPPVKRDRSDRGDR